MIFSLAQLHPICSCYGTVYIFLVNFWDLYNYFTWVASSLAKIIKKMLFTTGLPVHCFSSVSDWAIEESWRNGNITFFLLSFQFTTSKRGNACYVGNWYTNTTAFSLFWKTSNIYEGISMTKFNNLNWKELSQIWNMPSKNWKKKDHDKRKKY